MLVKRFNSYIEEAKKSVPSTDFLSNIKHLENAIKARIGKFSRLGYENLVLSKIGQGMGLTYIFDSPFDKAFRIVYAPNSNYSGRPTVVAINVWDHLRFNSIGGMSEPTVSIELGQYDIFDPKDFELVINIIVDTINRPKSGAVFTENFITEARHVTVDQFIGYVAKELNDPDPDIVDVATLNRIANKYGVGVPTAVRVSTKGADSRSLHAARDKAKVIIKKGISKTTGDVKELGYISQVQIMRNMRSYS